MDPRDVYLTGEEQLHELSTAEAEAVLQRFLEVERRFFATFRIDGIQLDHTQKSVLDLYRYVLDSGLYPQQSALWDMRCGYYLGEALTASSDKLRWTTGERGYMDENQPVIAGFSDGMECPVIIVSRNGLQSVIEGRNGFERIERATGNWFGVA